MIKKFQMQGARGAAGQSTGPQSSRYNFANLYSLNRNNSAMNQADKLGRQAFQATNAAQQAKNQYTQSRGSQGASQMAQAVKRAKGVSDKAQNFNPMADYAKQGMSGYQSAAQGFYSGAKTASAQARKFANTYKNALGIQDQMNATQFAPQEAPQQKPQFWSYDQQLAATTKMNQDQAAKAGRPGQTDLNRLTNLDWMLKTGRITTEEYYKAQNDNLYYDSLRKKYA